MNYPKAVIKKEETNTVLIDMDRVCEIKELSDKFNIRLRSGGEFSGNGIWLNDKFDWQIVRDSSDELVLLKLKKDK